MKYIYAGGQRVAMKKGSTVYFLLSDHLGSTTVTADSVTKLEVGELRFKAWGETRFSSGTTYTARHFTGQIDETGNIGLYFYGARFYDPVLGRFCQGDTIVPELGNPQAWDRYAYANNNPLRYIDPSGHGPCDGPYADPEDCANMSENEPPDSNTDPPFGNSLGGNYEGTSDDSLDDLQETPNVAGIILGVGGVLWGGVITGVGIALCRRIHQQGS